jgi:hypothetical protein
MTTPPPRHSADDDGSPVEPVLQSSYEVYRRTKARGTDPAAGLPFQPDKSPLHGRAVFLLGAPRSGTTWLQQLLVPHPQLATAGETHVFCEGVGALLDNHAGEDAYSGLSGWVTRPELVGLIRELVDGILLRLRDTDRPSATHVLDKTPNHVPFAAQVAEVYPDAAFIQIIRDGRDSAASAHDLWSWSSSYSDHVANAARWRDAVLDCRTHLSGLRYCEVRYEDLLADTPAQLARVLDTIGLPYDDDYLRRVADFGRTPVNVRPSRTEVRSRKWDRMAGEVERDMLVAAGDLLVELGYITEAHRRQVMDRRSLRRTVLETRELSERAGRKARATARKALRRRDEVDKRREVRRHADALARAVTDRDRAALASTLHDDVTLIDGADAHRGVDAVADELLRRLAGCRLLVLDADSRAATLRWSDGGSNQQLHQVQVNSRGEVDKVTIVREGALLT